MEPERLVIEPDRLTVLAFDSPEAARIFVIRLANRINHVAIFIDGEHVIVLDNGEEPRPDAIRRLARSSGAWRF